MFSYFICVVPVDLSDFEFIFFVFAGLFFGARFPSQERAPALIFCCCPREF
jgi:hypothetical protein